MSNLRSSLPLAVTCGDPAGIGPEVIAAALREEAVAAEKVILIGPHAWAQALSSEFGTDYEGIGPKAFSVQPGQPTVAGAELALTAMQAAAHGCIAGRYRAVVTGPVSKHWMQKIGYRHPGQTEFFAAVWGGSPTMAFAGSRLRVVLATWHIPLRDVSDALTAEALEHAVRSAVELAAAHGCEAPRIGVCGLNPHAGEAGLLGDEERDVLNPALDRLRVEIPGLSACLPGDTVFHRQMKGEFDVVVAAYHDQALAAVKTLEFDSAVNITLGLPYLRTSPDHGTAFELAGKGGANSGSMAAALYLAERLSSSKS